MIKLFVGMRAGLAGTALLLAAVASLVSQPGLADTRLTPHIASYGVKISVVSGELRTQLELTEEGHYVATHVIAPTGLSKLIARGSISETSEFADGGDGVIPVAYRSDDSLSRDKEHADIRFDWDRNEASGTVNEQDTVTVLEGLSHDRVSIQYQLMHDLLNDEPGTQYRLYEVDKLKILNIRSIGTRSVKVPAGTFEAVGIQHQAENSSRVTTLWCVAELDYLPVIIEQHRKGKLRVQAQLRSYTRTDDASQQIQ
ncbi:MAG: DUF3108 domain-containing protein [Gammaproteobacteria bacterium]|nr:DUF3108 domain-containing protein [Gammaproteobacteria bacterium]